MQVKHRPRHNNECNAHRYVYPLLDALKLAGEPMRFLRSLVEKEGDEKHRKRSSDREDERVEEAEWSREGQWKQCTEIEYCTLRTKGEGKRDAEEQRTHRTVALDEITAVVTIIPMLVMVGVNASVDKE